MQGKVQKLQRHAMAEAATADPTGRSEVGIILPAYPRLKQRAGPFYCMLALNVGYFGMVT